MISPCKCFCGKDTFMAKRIGDNTHYACTEHFSYSVNKKNELVAVSARMSEKSSLSWYKEMDFFKLIVDNKKFETAPIVSSMDELLIFVNSPETYIQNHMILD